MSAPTTHRTFHPASISPLSFWAGSAADRVPAVGELSPPRNVKTTEYFDCLVWFRPAA